MAKQQQMHMPGVFGGLMRYDEEYISKFMMSPVAIVVFIVAILLFVFLLRIFFPVNIVPSTGGVAGGHGFVWPLLNLLI